MKRSFLVMLFLVGAVIQLQAQWLVSSGLKAQKLLTNGAVPFNKPIAYNEVQFKKFGIILQLTNFSGLDSIGHNSTEDETDVMVSTNFKNISLGLAYLDFFKLFDVNTGDYWYGYLTIEHDISLTDTALLCAPYITIEGYRPVKPHSLPGGDLVFIGGKIKWQKDKHWSFHQRTNVVFDIDGAFDLKPGILLQELIGWDLSVTDLFSLNGKALFSKPIYKADKKRKPSSNFVLEVVLKL